MSRSINFESLPLAHPPALEWLRANGVDPGVVTRDQEVVVDDSTITVKLFVYTSPGSRFKRLGPDGEPLLEAITVPLISAPENHGL